MAEAAGLAVGTIALASLFQTCLDFLEYVEDARNTKDDQERGETKLGLLKIRLRQWGDDLQVLHPGHEDGGLREHWPEEGGTISRSLIGMAAILDEAAILNQKYASYNAGKLPESLSTVELHKESDQIHTPRWKYCKYLSIFKQRASWALKDKKKLNSLLTELEFFINNLEKVTTKLLHPGSFEYRQSPTYDYDSDMSYRNIQQSVYPPTGTRNYDSDMSRRTSQHSAHQSASSPWPPDQQRVPPQQALVPRRNAAEAQALVRLPASTSSGQQPGPQGSRPPGGSGSQGAPGPSRHHQDGTDKDGNTYQGCHAGVDGRQLNGNVDTDSSSGRHTYIMNTTGVRGDQLNGNSNSDFAKHFFAPRSAGVDGSR